MKLKSKIALGMILIFLILVCCTSTSMAKGRYAFSAGIGYNEVDMRSTTENCASMFGQMGYSSRYATDSANFNILNGTFEDGTKRLESDIVFLTGHGDWSGVYTLKGQGITNGNNIGEQYVGINTIYWINTRLVILLACETGAAGRDDHIAVNIFRRSGGSSDVLGWKQIIYASSAKPWQTRFNTKLVTGGSVGEAINYANSFSYANNSIRDIAFFGDWNRVMKLNRTTSQEIINENSINITEDVIYNGTEETLKNVVNEIKKLNEDFKLEDYKIDVYKLKEDADYYSITFTYKEGEFLTNSEYVVAVEEGKVKQITDNTIKNSSIMLMSNQEITDKEIEQAKMEATNKIERFKNNKEITSVEIKEQKTELYLDKNTNKKYIKVLSTYGFNREKGFAGDEFLYEI